MTGPTPLRIAHGYGNSRRWVQAALRGPVDMIEADLWYRGGTIWVRHERRLPLLPILYGSRPGGGIHPPPCSLPLARWHLRLDVRPLPLEQLIEAVGGRRPLLLDLKGPCTAAAGQQFVAKLAGCLRRFGLGPSTRLCGNWPLLDEIRRIEPALKVHYSIGNRAQCRATLLRLAEGDRIGAVSIHRSLLDEDRARFLQDRGIEVYCWPVDDAAEAGRLMALGVQGIISYDLSLLASLPVPTGAQRLQPL